MVGEVMERLLEQIYSIEQKKKNFVIIGQLIGLN